MALDLQKQEAALEIHADRPSVPVLLVGGDRRRQGGARRARQDGARARGEDGQAALDVHQARRVDSSPAIAGGRVFVGSNDGRVYGLDLASGKKVWEYEAASPVTSSPAVAKGKVVVATADGQVICFG
jgi:ribosomal protein L4